MYPLQACDWMVWYPADRVFSLDHEANTQFSILSLYVRFGIYAILPRIQTVNCTHILMALHLHGEQGEGRTASSATSMALRNKIKLSQAWWHTPTNPGLRREAGRLEANHPRLHSKFQTSLGTKRTRKQGSLSSTLPFPVE